MVYKISCKGCLYRAEWYILGVSSKRTQESGDSALAEHAMKSGHEIDWCQST